MRRITLFGMLGSALFLGILIAWVDTRPNWDDTGITTTTLFIISAGFGAINPRYAWLWGLALGIWIPLYGLIISHNPGSLMALGITLFGSYLGLFIRRLFSKTPPTVYL